MSPALQVGNQCDPSFPVPAPVTPQDILQLSRQGNTASLCFLVAAVFLFLFLISKCLSWADHHAGYHQHSQQRRDWESEEETRTYHLYGFQATSQGTYFFVQLSHAVVNSNILVTNMRLVCIKYIMGSHISRLEVHPSVFSMFKIPFHAQISQKDKILNLSHLNVDLWFLFSSASRYIL